MIVGTILETSLKGKDIILEPRTGLKKNEWLVEDGKFFGGASKYTLYCLVCEKQIPTSGCGACNDT